jgi:hypothetical protein
LAEFSDLADQQLQVQIIHPDGQVWDQISPDSVLQEAILPVLKDWEVFEDWEEVQVLLEVKMTS